MNFNQTITKTITVLSVAALISGAAFAYFTDKESKTNTFTVGSVDIILEEPSFPTPEDKDPENKDIVPNDVIPKDPQVTNTGKNDAYVYLEVTLPRAKVVTANNDGTKNKEAIHELFEYEINDGWTQLDAYTKQDDSSVTYVYSYNKIVKAGEKTNALFNEVTFINIVEGQKIGEVQEIEVVAKAIQSANTGSVEEAYVKLVNQLAK